jgi:DNA-binding NarL/FixJ family response regulator
MSLHSANPRSRKRAGSYGAPQKAEKKLRLIIIDEHPLCRKGLRDLLKEDGRFEIVAESDRTKTAAKTVLEQRPDAAVLDGGPQCDPTLEMVALLKTRKCKTGFVILAQQPDQDLFERALRAGIRGFVLKRGPLNEILDCIAAVASGSAYVTPALTDFLLQRDAVVPVGERQRPGIKLLTVAERHILKLIAQGRTSREIAAECRISPRTVGSHRTHICEKLGIHGTNCLLHFALEHGDMVRRLGHVEP